MLVDRCSTGSNFNDTNDQFVIDNLIQNSVVSLPDTVFLLTRKFFTADWLWIARKASDFFNNTNSIFFLNFFDFLRCRLFDYDPIACHFFSIW